MLAAARKGLKKLFAAQRTALKDALPEPWLETLFATAGSR